MNIDKLSSDTAPRVWPKSGISGADFEGRVGCRMHDSSIEMNNAGGKGAKNGDGCFGTENGAGAGGSQNGMGGNGASAGMLSSDALRAIQELSFVKAELELYLDTHPTCKTAIDYYHRTVDALDKLMAEYQAAGKPIVAAGSIDKDSWSWINGPWPWQRADDMKKEG